MNVISKVTKRQVLFFSFCLVLFCSLSSWGYAVFYGTPKTGLQNLEEGKSAYSIFVPEDYTPERSWPLVIALHDEGGSGDKYIQAWTSEAVRRGFIVLCPTYERMQENPQTHDEWLLKLKHELEKIYEIDSGRVLITGYGSGGHYAFYLALRYPEEFDAVASIGNAIHGPLTRLFRLPYAKSNRLPVLMLMTDGRTADEADLNRELEPFRAKGFQMDTVPAASIKTQEDPSAYPFVVNWFDETVEKRKKTTVAEGMDQKFYKWLDQIF